MIFEQHEQGSPEWYQARCGVVTASEFSTAVSRLQRDGSRRNKGDLTEAAEKYCGAVALERISGLPWGEPIKPWVLERGKTLEPAARMRYEELTGLVVHESGIVLSDDRLFGYSTDGFVGDDGVVEIKCPVDPLKILDMFDTGDTAEYDHQMHGGLWLTARQWCDFCMYVPALERSGSDLYVKRVYRDEEFIATLELQLIEFNQRVDDYVTRYKTPRSMNASIGYWPFPIVSQS